LTERAPESQAETHRRRWNVGLRVIDGSAGGYFRTERLEESSWVRSAWTVVVEDTIPSYLEESLQPALVEHGALSVIKNGRNSDCRRGSTTSDVSVGLSQATARASENLSKRFR